MKPIYNYFMDNAFKVGDVVELVTPARFLFNAGQTPKKWNKKMLNDEHFKVLDYERDSSNFFPNVEIKGGVAITIHNNKEKGNPIETFIPFSELKKIVDKVDNLTINYLDTIISNRGQYRFSDSFFKEYIVKSKKTSKGTSDMLGSDVFQTLPEIFSFTCTSKSVKIYGRIKNQRVQKFLDRELLKMNQFLNSYNVVIPKANGNGSFGETISSPFIASPGEGTTDTFMSLGTFNSEDEARALLKYIKTKFARALLSILKM